jgi:hypothetical protein
MRGSHAFGVHDPHKCKGRMSWRSCSHRFEGRMLSRAGLDITLPSLAHGSCKSLEPLSWHCLCGKGRRSRVRETYMSSHRSFTTMSGAPGQYIFYFNIHKPWSLSRNLVAPHKNKSCSNARPGSACSVRKKSCSSLSTIRVSDNSSTMPKNQHV